MYSIEKKNVQLLLLKINSVLKIRTENVNFTLFYNCLCIGIL